ncbi:MAG: nitrilase-related carbon-nitrogen hydrolase, partial [Acidimicrobiales bacterium]
MPRIALAQFRPVKGDYAANVERLGALFAQAAALEPKVDLLVTPEAATSGYFVEGGVRDVAVTAGTLLRDLAEVHRGAKAPPLDVAVGFYEVFQHHLYNSCLYASLGAKKPVVRHVHRKVFLPSYGVFDEERFVERGRDVRAFDTGWGGRAAILICEDAWHSLTATIAALDGAQLLVVPSASPARGTAGVGDGPRIPESLARWEGIVRGIAGEHGVYVALANLVGFEGGKGFAGGSVLVDPWGEIITRGPLFEEALVTAEFDPGQITRARAETPLLADLQVNLPHLLPSLGKRDGGRGKGKAGSVKFDAAQDTPYPSRFPLPASPVHVVGRGVDEGDPLAIDPELARRWLVSFLK